MVDEVGLKAVVQPDIDESHARREASGLEDIIGDRDFSIKPDISTDDLRAGLGREVGRRAGRALPGRMGSTIGQTLGYKIGGESRSSGGATGTSAGEADSPVPLMQEQLEVQEEILDILEDMSSPRGDDSMKKFGKGKMGLGLFMGGALGTLLGGGIILGRSLMNFLENFEWPDIEIPELPEIPVPDWIPISVTEPDWVPFTVVEPDWIPIPLTVPEIDPLTITRPEWIPLRIVKPDWLPFEDPTEDPSPTGGDYTYETPYPEPTPAPSPGGYGIPGYQPQPEPAPAPTPSVPPSEMPSPGIVQPNKPTRGPLTTEKWLLATLGLGVGAAAPALAASAGGMGAAGGGTIPGLASGGMAAAGTAGLTLPKLLENFDAEMLDVLPEGEWQPPTGLNADMRAGASSANTGPSQPETGGQGGGGAQAQVQVKNVYAEGSQLMVVIQKGSQQPLTMPYSQLPPAWQKYVQQWLSRNSQGGGGGGGGGGTGATGGNGGNRAANNRQQREQSIEMTFEQEFRVDPTKMRSMMAEVDRRIEKKIKEFEQTIDQTGAMTTNVSGGSLE